MDPGSEEPRVHEQIWTDIICYMYIECIVLLSLVFLLAGVCVCGGVQVYLVGQCTGTINPGGWALPGGWPHLG